jgi:hypothetical protein
MREVGSLTAAIPYIDLKSALNATFSHIDGRPHFAKLSLDDVKQVEIAAIDPDFRSRLSPPSLMEYGTGRHGYHCYAAISAMSAMGHNAPADSRALLGHFMANFCP